ncbi:unnamed protein product [Oikopleura dioica]|uniref:Uncharacterized protein n=1 Tax=Oikopleura dioica TaxID=34765 RepID=E4YEL0_OIKDI|nr:unnamed protein product [Oikopleura dioica]
MAEGKFSALRRSMAVPLRSAPPRPEAESAVAIYIPDRDGSENDEASFGTYFADHGHFCKRQVYLYCRARREDKSIKQKTPFYNRPLSSRTH